MKIVISNNYINNGINKRCLHFRQLFAREVMAPTLVKGFTNKTIELRYSYEQEAQLRTGSIYK